ncbi:pancreatic triacylglycerol lipase-like [Leptidea sinapis]|uniref:pancreatic triacylglycerol lipase-like n=1 Tax=Leptidea sinapis TaxID=189913 RepID=UPI002130C553|nr:pancreatic triacylglycerol lipase-like [Leptidea sinapis]
MLSVGKCVLILCAAIAVRSYPMSETDVIFHLYTRTNPTVSQPLLSSIASISMSSFSNNRKTIITIHSYDDDVTGNFNAFVVPAHLDTEDVNILAVDWRHGSFANSVGIANVPQLGQLIANFVNILINTFGYSPSLIRFVGLGLGAHAAGVASRGINGVIPHIVAIDPSLIGWVFNSHKLNSDDATVVEVLHATAGVYGYDAPLGTVDFYSNGGVVQAGCGSDPSCSHTLAYAYYAESIRASANNGQRFLGTACDNYSQALALACTGERDAFFGGTETKTGVSGVYIFLTNIRPPFARG